MKEVVFNLKEKNFIMCYKDQELALCIVYNPIKEAQSFFEQLNFPKLKIDNAIKSDRLDIPGLNNSDQLSFQYGLEVELLNGKDFCSIVKFIMVVGSLKVR